MCLGERVFDGKKRDTTESESTVNLNVLRCNSVSVSKIQNTSLCFCDVWNPAIAGKETSSGFRHACSRCELSGTQGDGFKKKQPPQLKNLLDLYFLDYKNPTYFSFVPVLLGNVAASAAPAAMRNHCGSHVQWRWGSHSPRLRIRPLH